MQPPANGTEERLDVLIDLLRQQLGQAQVPNNHKGEFEVREPAVPDAGQVPHSPKKFKKG